jgi:hypothetical protein
MTKKRRPNKPPATMAGGTPIVPASTQQRRELDQRTKKLYDRLRRRYPEVHGKVVDFISHSVEDGTLYVAVRFTDMTEFSFRFTSEMFVAGIDLSDWQTGDGDIIREYMRPIST